jgi:O-antigen ligase
VGVLFTLGYFVWRTRRWKLALLLLAVLALMPWLAVKTMPSLDRKLAYTIYDWKQYAENSGENYSDSERWVSLKTGWLIWQEQPILGAGAGDLRQETQRIVSRDFPNYQQTPKLPHNQFLYSLASTGLFGLLISMLVFVYPLLLTRYRTDFLFLAFQLMVFSSFLVEYTIETTMGVAWYLFFTLWFLKIAHQNRS